VVKRIAFAVPGDIGRVLELHVARERADTDMILRDLDSGESRDAVDVDENFRRREAEIHHRHQALAACEHPRLVLVRGKKHERLGDACRSRVGKARCFHLSSSVVL